MTATALTTRFTTTIAAAAMSLCMTLAVLGSLNHLATEEHAATVLAKAAATQQAQAAATQQAQAAARRG